MTSLEPEELIDSARYPIAQAGARREQIVAEVRNALDDDGCAVLSGFLSQIGLAALRAEAVEREPQAYYNPVDRANVHLGDPDPSLPDDHPRNRFFPRTNGFVRADEWDETTNSKRLYDWPPLKDFLQDCLGKDELHVYEDPVSNMIVNVQRAGQVEQGRPGPRHLLVQPEQPIGCVRERPVVLLELPEHVPAQDGDARAPLDRRPLRQHRQPCQPLPQGV